MVSNIYIKQSEQLDRRNMYHVKKTEKYIKTINVTCFKMCLKMGYCTLGHDTVTHL